MLNKTNKTVKIFVSAILIIVFVLIDQAFKSMAISLLKDKSDLIIIKDVLQLHYLENTGAAFSMLEGQQQLFAITTPILVLILIYILYKMPASQKYKALDYIIVFVISGAIGNYIDRISKNYVVDFIYFSLINFPVFNVADIYVTCSVIVLILLVLFYYKDEDFDEIGKAVLPWKK